MLQHEALVLLQVTLLQHQGLLAAGGAGANGVAAGSANDSAAIAVAYAGVGIRGSSESQGLMHLSMIRAKYINSSMLSSWVMILSCF